MYVCFKVTYCFSSRQGKFPVEAVFAVYYVENFEVAWIETAFHVVFKCNVIFVIIFPAKQLLFGTR